MHQHYFYETPAIAGCGVMAVGTNELPAAAGKSEFGLIGVVGGMTMIELLAYAMRSVRGKIAAVENENYCDNLLW